MSSRWQITASRNGIMALRLKRKRKAASFQVPRDARAKRLRARAETELREYFAGRRKSFASRCDIDRLPAFTQAVLRLAAKIPYGEVRSYQWLARKLGKPKAARAVGSALARNPIPIIIPCHRIVRRDGAIGNFLLGSGWKKRLLDLEKSSVKTKTSFDPPG